MGTRWAGGSGSGAKWSVRRAAGEDRTARRLYLGSVARRVLYQASQLGVPEVRGAACISLCGDRLRSGPQVPLTAEVRRGHRPGLLPRGPGSFRGSQVDWWLRQIPPSRRSTGRLAHQNPERARGVRSFSRRSSTALAVAISSLSGGRFWRHDGQAVKYPNLPRTYHQRVVIHSDWVISVDEQYPDLGRPVRERR